MMQEPKYEFRDGQVFNRASGEVIPQDEPVMLFRARDIHVLPMLAFYLDRVEDPSQVEAVVQRMRDFRLFKINHSERMKEPDTDLTHGKED